MRTRSWLVRIACAVALASALPAPAQLTTDPAYTAGRDAWNRRQWAVAIDALRPLVDPSDRANYEVDYWLGTSLCRSEGRLAHGANILDWSLRFRNMPEAARPMLDAEKRLCVQQLQAGLGPGGQAPPTLVAMAGGVATVKGTPKMIAVGGGDGLLAAAPIRVTRPLPAAELEARLVPLGQPERALDTARRLAPGSRLHVSKHTVIASTSPAHTAASLRKIGDRLDDFVAFLGDAYDLRPPPTYMAVYLFPDIASLGRAGMRLHGMQANAMTLGYTFGNDRSILGMMTGTGAGTLLHELFHTVVHESFGAIPQWLDEGVASLYETATAAEGMYFGEPNWRSKVYADLSGRVGGIDLEDLVTAPWFSDEPRIHRQLGERAYNEVEQAYLLAFARMFTLYLQETRSLHKVFDAFRHRDPMPDNYVPATQRAVRLLEQAMGKPLPLIEADFRQWAPKAYDPNTRFYAGTTRAQEIRKELPPGATEIRRELPDALIEREPAGR